MQRNSILNDRHRELGSKLDGDTWNNMPIPWSYNSDFQDEAVAVRSCAGLFDVSSLNFINFSGADAEAVIDKLVSIDVTKMTPGSSRLSAACWRANEGRPTCVRAAIGVATHRSGRRCAL